MKPIDLSNRRFGRLRACRVFDRRKTKRRWLCECDCGHEAIVVSGQLLSGHTRSCGCILRDARARGRVTHQQSGSREYRIWGNIRQRCLNPRCPSWKDYGGRGIELRFPDFESFLGCLGRCPPGMSVDRIDTDGHYEPGNVRWATPNDQARNTRRRRLLTFRGETRHLSEWAEMYGVPVETLHGRIENGWYVGSALSAPIDLARSHRATPARSSPPNPSTARSSGEQRSRSGPAAPSP